MSGGLKPWEERIQYNDAIPVERLIEEATSVPPNNVGVSAESSRTPQGQSSPGRNAPNSPSSSVNSGRPSCPTERWTDSPVVIGSKDGIDVFQAGSRSDRPPQSTKADLSKRTAIDAPPRKKDTFGLDDDDYSPMYVDPE